MSYVKRMEEKSIYDHRWQYSPVWISDDVDEVDRLGYTLERQEESTDFIVHMLDSVPKEVKNLRVCSYCRISTGLECQRSSIEGQELHYEDFIKSNPDWDFAGTYLETGITGTKAEIRPELQRLIKDCREGRIDLILTKSISRFARNTSDCLEMIRLFRSLGVHIRFEKEQIWTDSMDSEFMLSILAALAEDESRSISGNMKWGIRKRFGDGTYKQSLAPYGYCLLDGLFQILPDEAAVVREIFDRVLRGQGTVTIARSLNERKIPSPTGRQWSPATLRQMISNHAYMGDVLYQKSFKDDLYHQRPNRGELDSYYDTSHHEAIIDRNDFEAAQRVIRQNARKVGYYRRKNCNEMNDEEDHNRGSRRYAFTGILSCGLCGSVMHRQRWRDGRICWICSRHVRKPDLCPMKPQSDSDLKAAFINCLNKLAWNYKSRDCEDLVLDAYERLIIESEKSDGQKLWRELEERIADNIREKELLIIETMHSGLTPEQRERKLVLQYQELELLIEKKRLLDGKESIVLLRSLQSFVRDWTITDCLDHFPENEFRDYVESCDIVAGNMMKIHFQCGLTLTESLRQIESS